MHSSVNAISGRLSLRKPQREGLEILDRVVEIAPPNKESDVQNALETIRSEFPYVTDFERDFPSLCFALATGVGKTRLMGAFISYLHTAHGMDNFFVLAPNLTIYNKLIVDFTPGTPKYVFKGVSAFAVNPPDIITGETWESYAGRLFDPIIKCRINIFNISKINTEVRGGRSPRIKRLSEYIGESYFEWLSKLPDLVLLMDESHRYRASAGVRAISELDPILGLELTATPYVTRGSKTEPFRNVIQDYSLRRAMEDGFVKEPAVVTRQNFNASGMAAAELERMKLEDGVRLHEQTKVELETFARNSGQPRVKPFVLVIARDTTHASQLLELIKSDNFFDGRYADKVIQVDSSGSGVEKDETVERLLKVESADEPTEIVIHVNMLKEGWDVTNLYTIVPLRAANAKVLIEQTIGRGLRLPYGKRTGVAEVDRLSIVAHDKFQEIVDEASRSDSIIQMQRIVLSEEDLRDQPRSMVIRPTIEDRLGIPLTGVTDTTTVPGDSKPPLFANEGEQDIAKIAYEAIKHLQSRPQEVPDISWLKRPEVQERLVQEVEATYNAGQLGLDGMRDAVDTRKVVEATARAVVDLTISIPRITVVPVDEVRSWFEPFELDLSGFRYPAVSETLVGQALRTGDSYQVSTMGGHGREQRLEDYVITGLIDFDEISYDDHAELLQEIATQVVRHFRTYLASDEEVEGVLAVHQREIARNLFSQMIEHHKEEATEYISVVTAGFTPIRESAAKIAGDIRNFRHAPERLSEIRQTVFGGFQRCLQSVMKFDSNPERMLAVILDRESQKWLRPAAGQFQISYRNGVEISDYHPDFVAELDDRIAMLEPKRSDQMRDSDVLAKRAAGIEWCEAATKHAETYGGKPWVYALIPHDVIFENQTIDYLLQRYGT